MSGELVWWVELGRHGLAVVVVNSRGCDRRSVMNDGSVFVCSTWS